jgi:hypothetical protein
LRTSWYRGIEEGLEYERREVDDEIYCVVKNPKARVRILNAGATPDYQIEEQLSHEK